MTRKKIISTPFGQPVSIEHGEKVTLYSLVRTAAGMVDDDDALLPNEAKKANSVLKHYGLRVDGRYVAVANNQIPPGDEILAGTFLGTDLKGALKRLPGHDNYENKPQNFGKSQNASKVVRIPLSLVVGDDAREGPF